MSGDGRAVYGSCQQPPMAYPYTDNYSMKITDHISANLSAWMAGNDSLDTCKKVSARSGVGFGTVRRTKNGDGNPTITNLYAIARAFNRRVEDLLAAPEGEKSNVVPLGISEPPAPTCAPIVREIIDLVERMEDRGKWELIGEARMLARLYPKQKNSGAQ